jgi:hypothetical protein
MQVWSQIYDGCALRQDSSVACHGFGKCLTIRHLPWMVLLLIWEVVLPRYACPICIRGNQRDNYRSEQRSNPGYMDRSS